MKKNKKKLPRDGIDLSQAVALPVTGRLHRGHVEK
jgi:hypothetical protein